MCLQKSILIKKKLFMLKDVNLYKEEKNHNLDVNRMLFL
jgi:hypothetical protein